MNLETPLMKQYNAIKTKHPGALLLFRVGDFYETFGEDAIKASKILDIVLTKRANGSASEIELAGFPHHALDNYLPKLVRAGQRVAICDQLEDPKFAKGIVKRGVTELVTPGVSLNDNVLDVRKNNYLASLHFSKEKEITGIALLDISTGEFLTAQGNDAYIEKVLQSFQPSEIIYSKKEKQLFKEKFEEDYTHFAIDEWVYKLDYGYEKICQHFKVATLKGFGIEQLQEGIVAAGAILYYLQLTEHNQLDHVLGISRIDEERYVWLDQFTIRNLELLFPQHENGVSLLNILDKTVTHMGARLLRKWIVLPLKSKQKIEERLEIVDYFTKNEQQSNELLKYLRQIADLERLITKVATARINPREMQLLKKSLLFTQKVKQELYKCNENLHHIAEKLAECHSLYQNIENALQDELPIASNLGNIIKEGISSELDELRQISGSGKAILDEIVEKESRKTGIPSLKLSYNRVFGYYLEVRNTHKDKVPKEWIRKQTLVSAERYITEELKVYEEKILNAESRIVDIEVQLFKELVEAATEYIPAIQQNARLLAQLDCLLSFSTVSVRQEYNKPMISEEKILEIRKGRHPVIEQQLPFGELYVPNDVFLDNETCQIMVITGPNMSGKSAILRQTALIVLMAQMGIFVPAYSAQIGLIDKVFTRVGASDNLSRGESTFMVEMLETSSILHNLSDRSLVLMDEIGRGTSTYDGISIAWAIVEHLHQHKYRPKTLFATHYHELNELTNDFPRVRNFNVSVKEAENKVIFLRRLQEGGSEHSFGIHVAQMAGMPNQIVLRANEILEELEKNKTKDKNKARIKDVPKSKYQLNIFEAENPQLKQIRDILVKTDINTISPVEALLKLNELKQLL